MSYFEEYMLDLKEMRNQAQIKRDNNKISKEQLLEIYDLLANLYNALYENC